jgi:glycosyltransferase involved in cell wall biosynthesis
MDHPIRVALDARWAQKPQNGGVARGIRSLVPRLAGKVDFLALIDPRWGPLDLDVPTVPLTMPLTSRAMVWLHLRLPFALRDFPGIFHSPFNLLPLWMPIPSVVTIHDISFETHPHLFPTAKARAFSLNARWAARRSGCVTTVSQWAREQILDRYRIDEERVQVVPNGVEPEFHPLTPEDAEPWARVRRVRKITEPYVVALGGAARRGLDIALGAWRLMRADGLPHSFVALDDEGPPEPGVTWVPRPSQRELQLTLAGADLLLYPTETESFGMPALEAAACGTPPLCPRVGALPEILGNAAVWCERNSEALSSAAIRLLRGSDSRAAYAQSGRQLAAHWTWDKAAEHLLRVYTRASNAA